MRKQVCRGYEMCQNTIATMRTLANVTPVKLFHKSNISVYSISWCMPPPPFSSLLSVCCLFRYFLDFLSLSLSLLHPSLC